MKRFIISILAVANVVALMAGPISFTGNGKTVITEKPEASTGLDELFVLYNTSGVSANYTASTSQPVTWYRYSNLGGGYAEEVTGIVTNGKTSTLSKVESDMGYIVEEGSSRYYFWVVDYSKHYFDVNALNIADEQECDRVALNISGNADAIKYYTINGQAKELDREIMLRYNTLQLEQELGQYVPTVVNETYKSVSATVRAQAPLCNTSFTLSGDRFLRMWGLEESVESPYFETQSVDAYTTATQAIREIENEQKEETQLGGSAPVEIEFVATYTDAVVYTEWQFATDTEFENIYLRISDPVVNHTFSQQGTFYVRFVASNAAGSCDYYSDTYEVFVGESALECPNAFSPDATEGINDEWKVSYKSIVSFECHIFNRWGIQVAHLTHPSQGWDGKHGGKYVPSGVYYYVIKAEGADGRKYNLKGDINIIKYDYKGGSSSSSSATE